MNGERLPVLLSGAMLEKDSIDGIAYILDISDLKRVEHALRASEERYRMLFEVESDAILLVDCETGRLIDANTAAVAMYGYSRVELLHLKHSDVSDDPQLTEEAIAGNVTLVPVRRHRKKDGTVFPVEIAGAYFENQGRKVHVAAIRDITLRQQAEETLVRLSENLRSLTERLQTVQELERLAIARDIHDEIGQQLTALKLDIAWLRHRISADRNELGERLDDMGSNIDLLIGCVQRIAADLRPPLLDNLGLAAAIGWQVSEFTRRSGIECITMLNEDADPSDPQTATAIVRIVQEALTNVIRHSEATEVSISLCRNDGGLLLEISDNGRGVGEEEIAAHDAYGLIGMQERARICHGELTITGSPGCGTRLRLTIPIKKGDTGL
jgi:PAS domain S-box-containing protein